MADLTAPPSDTRTRIDQLSRRAARLHRRILDTDVLRGLMPLRLPQAASRAAAPPARDREQRFCAASTAYAAAGGEQAPGQTQRRLTTVDSLKWWVPLPVPDDPERVERALRHQDFPYRVISQTREVALGGIMIDIGANIGRMSIPRVILGDIDVAYCAEPDPLNYACLVGNIRDNGLSGLVLPDRVAIGSANETVRLRRGKTAGGPRVVDGAASASRIVEVESLTLDTWVERAGIDLEQLAFVKVDAQGSEVHVLRGASRVLARRHVAWQIEVDLKLLASRGFTADDLYAPLRQHFSHFIDLGHHASGERLRRIDEINDALQYVTGGSEGRTDVLVFTLESVTESP